ncbi:hypothetical protein MW887_001913 [Aspergillus wentii]|nr:hypothetical protein MW887_001913 [Aspergillus wentii]
MCLVPQATAGSEGRPSCSQCLRVNKKCYGYRDPNALRVYDQTKEVITRSATVERIVPQPVSITNDDRAISHLFHYYVGTVQNPGVMSYLPALLSTDPSPALQATIKAIGLASIPRRPELKRLAAEQYGIALRATNNALRHPDSALSDSTLGAVFLLGGYEMITCQASDFLHNWINHVHGATKLLELRGAGQLDTQAGLELFIIVRIQNAISSMFFRLPSHSYNSPKIAALSEAARAKGNQHFQPIEDLFDLLVEMNDLYIEADGAKLNHESIESWIARALHLDAKLQSWAISQSSFWQYTVVDRSLGNHIYPMYGDRYHVYNSVVIASIWNHYRQTRIILNQIIKSMSLRLGALQQTPEYQLLVLECIANIAQMADEICASVPYHFISGEVVFGGTFRLLWPLFFAAKFAPTESAVREWILHTLDEIGRSTGLQQAIGMSKVVTEENLSLILPVA